mmetsp:Transcript_39622/g.124542  ORF Transcript_39622/g.124542 Transcript_39622/m.124542 type:complete len:238 (-) Transcript_39622:1285-1998(-)
MTAVLSDIVIRIVLGAGTLGAAFLFLLPNIPLNRSSSLFFDCDALVVLGDNGFSALTLDPFTSVLTSLGLSFSFFFTSGASSFLALDRSGSSPFHLCFSTFFFDRSSGLSLGMFRLTKNLDRDRRAADFPSMLTCSITSRILVKRLSSTSPSTHLARGTSPSLSMNTLSHFLSLFMFDKQSRSASKMDITQSLSCRFSAEDIKEMKPFMSSFMRLKRLMRSFLRLSSFCPSTLSISV